MVKDETLMKLEPEGSGIFKLERDNLTPFTRPAKLFRCFREKNGYSGRKERPEMDQRRPQKLFRKASLDGYFCIFSSNIFIAVIGSVPARARRSV